MCGIIGYLGKREKVQDSIIKGLKVLEYRGYDSSGVCYLKDDKIIINKSVGKIKDLENKYDFRNETSLAIGHTRWATHGEVNEINTHPHVSNNKRITLVHNGVINNYQEIKEFLIDKGYSFYSQTDSEVLANLIDFLLKDSMLEVLNKLKDILKGSYALLIIDKKEHNKLYFIKNLTPLLIGKSDAFNILISDVNAGSLYTNEFVSLDDHQYGYITQNNIYIYENNTQISYKVFVNNSKKDDIGLNGFPHYMIKEIYEQPSILGKICNTYINEYNQINNIDTQVINNIKNSDYIYIVACGTSYHAGLIGKYVIEKELHKGVDVLIASEFNYQNMVIKENSYFIFISQSGETYDVKVVLNQIKVKHHNLLLTNVVSSTLARECESCIDILAGPEIAVASTKAYSAQVAILLLIVYACLDKLSEYKKEIVNVCDSMQETLIRSHHLLALVKDNIIENEHCFFIGKGVGYYLSLEASLKMKEISYIHSEAFPSGELKHGTIALIDKNTPVIGVINSKDTMNNVRSNLEEVRSRKAKTITISMASLSQSDDEFIVNDVSDNMLALAFAPVFQLMAYYAALLRYKDIDKPRNLAKSVTVE